MIHRFVAATLALALAAGVPAAAQTAPAQTAPAQTAPAQTAPAQTAPAPDVFASDGSADIVWRQTFASPGDDWVNLIVPLRNGDVLAVGFVDRSDVEGADWRALAARLKLDGSVVWRTEHGAGKGVDAFWSAVETASGELMAAGFTTRIGSGDIDAYVAQLGADGALQAEAAFGGAPTPSPDGTGFRGSGYDRTTDIVRTPDGGFIAVGFTSGAGRGRDLLVIGLGPDGKERWRRNHGREGDDQALYIEPAGDGGYILSGGVSEGEDGQILVMKIDVEGRELWRRVVGESGGLDVPHNLIVRPDGRIATSGYTASWGSQGPHDLFSLTLSPAGEVQRLEVFGGAGDDRGMVSGIDAQGRIWLTGYTRSAGAGGWDVFLTRIDAEGSFERFVTTFGGGGDDNGTAALPLADGSLLLAAYTTSLRPDGGQDAVLMRVAEPRWTTPHPAFTRRRIQ